MKSQSPIAAIEIEVGGYVEKILQTNLTPNKVNYLTILTEVFEFKIITL